MTVIDNSAQWKLMQWHSLVRNKRVALLGGDDDVNWAEVFASDLVVRVNTHWERQQGPIDILYFSCADDLSIDMFDNDRLYDDLKFVWVNGSNTLFNGQQQIAKFAVVCDLLKKRGVKMGLYCTAPARAFEVFANLREIPERFRWSKDLATRWNFHPLTGMAALYHLTLAPTASVYVDGMSLYARPDGTLPNTAGTHDIDSQVRFLKEFSAEQLKLVFSDKLHGLLVKHQPGFRG